MRQEGIHEQVVVLPVNQLGVPLAAFKSESESLSYRATFEILRCDVDDDAVNTVFVEREIDELLTASRYDSVTFSICREVVSKLHLAVIGAEADQRYQADQLTLIFDDAAENLIAVFRTPNTADELLNV